MDELTRGTPFLIPLLTAALLILGCWRLRSGLGRALVTAGLAVCAAFASLNYVAVHIERGEYSNRYEMFHYYLPTRYVDELGYTGLYDATVAARHELGLRPVERVRNLRTDEHGPYKEALSRAPKARARFTPERWAEWKADIAWFEDNVSMRQWAQMLEDRGYNATPPWTMVARPLSAAVRPGVGHGLLPLSLLDVGVWLLGLSAVAWGFGGRALLLLLIVLGTHYVTGFTTLKAAYLRVDWICALLGAMAFERRGHPAVAGALVAWAGLSRVFPFVFAFGPLVVLVSGWIQTRRLDRRALTFLVSLGLVSAGVALASVLATSPAYWRAFFEKIAQLSDSYTAWRVGLVYLLAGAWDGRAWGGEPLAIFYSDHAWLSALGKVVALVACAWLALRVREPWERLIIGFILMFCLVGSLYYYYVVLLVPALWLSTRLADPRGVAVLSTLLLGSVAAQLAHLAFERGAGTFFTVSCSILALILGIFWLVRADHQRAAVQER